MNVFYRYAQSHDVLFSSGELEFNVSGRYFKGDECALKALSDLARGDSAVLARLVEQVRSMNQLDLDTLQAGVNVRDKARVAQCSHKMSGAACMFKYEPLARHCSLLEHACEHEPWAVLIELFRRIEWLIHRLDQSLAQRVMGAP